MSLPLIPLLTVFMVALTFMLIGLCLSSRTFATGQHEVEDISHHRSVPQRRASRNVSIHSPTNTYRVHLKRVRGERRTWDQRISNRIQDILAKSKLASEIYIILKDLITYVVISNWPNIKYMLKNRLKKRYNRIVLILAVGLIFSISTSYIHKMFSLSYENYYTTNTDRTEKPIDSPIIHLQLPQGVSAASKALKRLAQLDRTQYSSEQEYNIWAASACSAAAMTVVMNAYGHNYRISDILQVEISQSAISSDLGLLELEGIDRTVAQFGFGVAQLSKAPLDSIISVANNGWPVIVNFPPSRIWPGGHILVITGGDSKTVFLADSGPANVTAMPHQQFLQNWNGFAVLIMPKER